MAFARYCRFAPEALQIEIWTVLDHAVNRHDNIVVRTGVVTALENASFRNSAIHRRGYDILGFYFRHTYRVDRSAYIDRQSLSQSKNKFLSRNLFFNLQKFNRDSLQCYHYWRSFHCFSDRPYVEDHFTDSRVAFDSVVFATRLLRSSACHHPVQRCCSVDAECHTDRILYNSGPLAP